MSQKTVLIVYDNKLNRAILCKILQSAGYNTMEAENGQTALDILHDKSSDISLILLDIIMPVMDGYTFLSEMNRKVLSKQFPL